MRYGLWLQMDNKEKAVDLKSIAGKRGRSCLMEYAVRLLEEEVKTQLLRLKRLKERSSLVCFIPECEVIIKELKAAIEKLKGE